jgi:hypothetical protein
MHATVQVRGVDAATMRAVMSRGGGTRRSGVRVRARRRGRQREDGNAEGIIDRRVSRRRQKDAKCGDQDPERSSHDHDGLWRFFSPERFHPGAH